MIKEYRTGQNVGIPCTLLSLPTSTEGHVTIYLAHGQPRTPDQKAQLTVNTQPTRKVTTRRRFATQAGYCNSLGVEFARRNKNLHKGSRCFERTCLYMSSNNNSEIHVVVSDDENSVTAKKFTVM